GTSRPRTATLFPYTTRFRSTVGTAGTAGIGGRSPGRCRTASAGSAGSAERLVPTALVGLMVRTDVAAALPAVGCPVPVLAVPARSEEHTSELQSRFDLVCRL